MKQTLVLIAFFLTLSSLGQKLTEKVGEIEIQIILHYFEQNSNHEWTKKITNRRNRPNAKMYFDAKAMLLKSISFGKHHDTDLRLLNEIRIYQYDTAGLSSKVDIWRTDYDKNLSHTYYKLFDLDSTGNKIIAEKMYDTEPDTLFTQSRYWYNKQGEYQGTFIDSTYYYKTMYDGKDRKVTYQQIYDSRLRWEWQYTYSDNQRIGLFQTYYKDGDDHSKKEIRTYNERGLLVEFEEFDIPDEGFKEKTKIYYDDMGIIKKIENYRLVFKEDGYEFVSYIDIKLKSNIAIDSEMAARINKRIYGK